MQQFTTYVTATVASCAYSLVTEVHTESQVDTSLIWPFCLRLKNSNQMQTFPSIHLNKTISF